MNRSKSSNRSGFFFRGMVRNSFWFNIGAIIVEPDLTGLGLFGCRPVVKKQDIGLDAVRIKNTGRQALS
jgi:hypothetical protein